MTHTVLLILQMDFQAVTQSTQVHVFSRLLALNYHSFSVNVVFKTNVEAQKIKLLSRLTDQ